MNRTTLLLVRHGHTDAVGRQLAGRTGLDLSASGHAQAERLARQLHDLDVRAIYSSPLRRAVATAAPVAAAHALPLLLCDGLTEIDFGDWTGRLLEDLEPDPQWQAFNRQRTTATIPGGESPLSVQRRVLSAIATIHQLHPSAMVLAVSHGDVIRSAVLHYMNRSLDRIHEFDVDPASISALEVDQTGGRVLFVNERNRPNARLYSAGALERFSRRLPFRRSALR